ncbi:MAG: hypothetical protein MRZ98_04605 [Clostridiales bacterium]|nr:hypothetical protein [Clostridiales bacterium]
MPLSTSSFKEVPGLFVSHGGYCSAFGLLRKYQLSYIGNIYIEIPVFLDKAAKKCIKKDRLLLAASQSVDKHRLGCRAREHRCAGKSAAAQGLGALPLKPWQEAVPPAPPVFSTR